LPCFRRRINCRGLYWSKASPKALESSGRRMAATSTALPAAVRLSPSHHDRRRVSYNVAGLTLKIRQGEPAPALIGFVGRRRRIDHLLDRLGSEFGGAELVRCTADRLRGGPGTRRRMASERDVTPDQDQLTQHLGLHLQIIVLALPCHFFLIRSEIAHAPSDFVAF
jgi:hypothetical protein